MPRGDAAVRGRSVATRRSALWAAWGDALGFPAELVSDSADLRRRVAATKVETTVSWRRRIGGRMGADVDLPAGMYSDDTQLRLAVSRSIRIANRFDVEAFSKIELPVFLAYGFGIGRGTRAAAQALAKRSVRWYSNFFDTRASVYIAGGGNGAAMRIQPHVWAASELSAERVLPGVVRDSVVTHGHVRGILGAALHALSLAAVMREGAPPGPGQWTDMVSSLKCVGDTVAADEALRERWIPVWEQNVGRPFGDAVAAGISELREMTKLAMGASAARGPLEARYAELVEAVGGRDPATRGSGTVSAVLALWLAHESGGDAAAAVRCAANLLGSDTDTLASMTGALVGPFGGDILPGPLVDAALIAAEAERLAELAAGASQPSFAHPDPLRWQPPKTQADALGLLDGKVVLAGLGPGRELGQPVPAQDGSLRQWVELQMGQTVLVKRRPELPVLPAYAAPQTRAAVVNGDHAPPLQATQQQLPTVEAKTPSGPTSRLAERTQSETRYPDSIDAGVALVVSSRFERILVSGLLFHYALQEDGPTRAAIFAARVADELRAYENRARPQRRRQ